MSMTQDVPFDVLEMILLVLDVKHIIRCKSVCKSWHCFISGPRFVKAHLKNIIGGGGHRRIKIDGWGYITNFMFVVGSCNGLVCASPKDNELDVINPWTREIKKLQKHHFHPDNIYNSNRQNFVFGFGYDASTDDYKVVTGFRKSDLEKRTDFYVLALKSNVWKFIGQVDYTPFKKSGVFFGGALHWFMTRAMKKIIMSVHLSTDECNEIPQPEDPEYECGDLFDHKLGVLDGCLCMYSSEFSNICKIWVIKNDKWELYDYNNNESKYDVVHSLTLSDSHQKTRYGYTIDDGIIVPRSAENRRIINGSMFVESLVSPHPPKVQTEGNNDAKGNIRKARRKRKKRSCKHKRVFF